MSTPISRDEALTLIRRKGLWHNPGSTGLLLLVFLPQQLVNLNTTRRVGLTWLLWLHVGLVVVIVVLLVAMTPMFWRRWRASRHAEGVVPLTVLHGPVADRPVRDEAGRDWTIDWQGHILAPGTTVWATPLEEGRPCSVVVPLLGQGASGAQVLYSVRGPRPLA